LEGIKSVQDLKGGGVKEKEKPPGEHHRIKGNQRSSHFSSSTHEAAMAGNARSFRHEMGSEIPENRRGRVPGGPNLSSSKKCSCKPQESILPEREKMAEKKICARLKRS